MKTTVSTKGQVVLPSLARRKLGIRAGTKLDCTIRGGSVILTPRRAAKTKSRMVRDRATGLIVTDGGPTVTSDQVRAALVDFP